MSMQLNRILTATALGSLLALTVACPVHAVDGVIEINQARALAGGVTLGDAPGFPVEIKSPGSYRLTGNLDLTATPPGLAEPEKATAILVSAPDVTIDLNGFTINGPVSCSGAPVSICTPSTGAGVGINASNQLGVAVMNGTVRGMGSFGLLLGGQSQVEQVRALSNGTSGIDGAGTVANCTASSNGANGIEKTGTVVNTTAENNGSIGIDADTVVSCTTHNNVNGIQAKTVANCTARNNTGIGILATAAIGCTALSNGTNLSASGIAGHNICGPPNAACP